jgi:hypothetical protein
MLSFLFRHDRALFQTFGYFTLLRSGQPPLSSLRVFSDWGRQSQVAPLSSFRDWWLFVPAGYSLLFAVGAKAAA